MERILFDLDGYDISFCSNIQNLLKSCGFDTDSVATDEDGCSHKIKFSNGYCVGEVHTSDGKIELILSDTTPSGTRKPRG